jgi:hypothetical protein
MRAHPLPTTRPSSSLFFAATFIVAAAASSCGDRNGAATPSGEYTQSVSSPLSLTLQPGAIGKDARIFSLPTAVNTPGGALPTLPALVWTWGGVAGIQRSLIDFDLSSVPPGAVISNATLTLFADTADFPNGHSQLTGTNELLIRRITAPWNEDTVTWNTQPTTDAVGQLTLPKSTSASQNYVIDVTAFINQERAAPTQNYGLMLQLVTEQQYRAVSFASSDNANAALRPKLDLTYTLLGQIYGSVVDINNHPIAGAVVTAGGLSAVSNANGAYTIQNVPPGTYVVQATKAGWTFGSASYQGSHYTVTITATNRYAVANLVGYDRDPIVFVHGWSSSPQDFEDIPTQMKTAGYYTVANQLATSVLSTPPFSYNANLVRSWINDSKDVTGRDQVILYAQSMGGLVARSYLEGGNYADDVSQIFTYGSPHLGTPNVLAPACVVTQDAICEMTQPGMLLFNATHFKRAGTNYHLIAGDAPMWQAKRVCVNLHFFKLCVNLIIPDHTFRNTKGWAMGALIPGADDGFIQTPSAAGELGCNIDRFFTQEVHTSPGLGQRDYHIWDGHPSEQGFGQCSKRVLIDLSTSTCGSRLGCGPPPGFFPGLAAPLAPLGVPGAALALAAPLTAPSAPADDIVSDGVTSNPGLQQSSLIDQGTLFPGATVARTVNIEGGPTAFNLSWDSGSATFKLVDPTGQVIDAAYVNGLAVDPSDPQAVDTTVPDPDTVVYSSDGASAGFYFPNARPGVWQVIAQGGSDLPAAGVSYTSAAAFDGTLMAAFTANAAWAAPGSSVPFTLQLSRAVQAATVKVRVRRSGGGVDDLVLAANGSNAYSASYLVPNTPGYAQIEWSVVGTRTDGVAFERGGRQMLQIMSGALTLGTGHTDHAVPRTGAPTLNDSLIVTLEVSSTYGGADLGVSGDLVSASGVTVAHSVVTAPAQVGVNSVDLRFLGSDIYRAQIDGPYTVRNVMLIDQRRAALLSAQIATAYTTATYASRSFAPAAGLPSVFVDGPYRVEAGQAITLTATGVDPEGGVLAYAWDLDGDGTYELSGQSLTYVAPASAAGFHAMNVRVTDPQGNAGVATTSIEVFVPTVTNLALAADATATSTFPGYSVAHIHDGDENTATDPAVSWSNNATEINGNWTANLPDWIELDLHAPRTLKRIELYTSADYPIQDYDLQTWDGSSWTTVAQMRGNTSVHLVHALSNVVAAKVRLVGYKGPAIQPIYVRVNELEIYGY